MPILADPTRRLLVVSLAALSLACSKGKAPEAAAAAKEPSAPVPMAAGHTAPATAAPAAAPATAPALTGTVLETMDSGGYTYMKLKTESGETWAAVNEAKVEKGATVTISSPMAMDGFESKTLNRKFDHIVFGNLGAPGVPGSPADVAARHASVGKPAVDPGEVKVAKAEGPEGRTIAEVYAGKAALKGKAVAVRGKVVKFNGGIMGRNWIHLRDGSGKADSKDDDLTVTTSEKAAIGDVVLVKGTLAVDKDFGSGYAYAVIVEDAKLAK